MYRLIIAGLGVAAAALLALGCGGGGGDQATAQVSAAQFMKQANAVCAKTQEELNNALKETASGKGDLFKQSSALLKQEAEELEAIEGPKAVEARVEPLIANISKASALIAHERQRGLESSMVAAYKREAQELTLKDC